jgi:hypothetical protein
VIGFRHSSPKCFPKRNWSFCPHNLYMNAHSSFSLIIKKLEKNPSIISMRTEKQVDFIHIIEY